uniref:Uncharacterized protein n=1 Tax=Amphimedon queenslandica TaxID=400682 RepID=A0A1X7VDV5_AMPQE
MSTHRWSTVLTLVFAACVAVCIAHEGRYKRSPLSLNNYGRTKRQAFRDYCETQLNNTIPPSCNLTVFGVGSSVSEFPEGSSEELAALNLAYAENCIPACINPVLQYYWCLSTGLNYSSNFHIYYSLFVQNYLCGNENGEYCRVKGGRLKGELAIPEAKVYTCNLENVPKNDLPTACNNTSPQPQSCYDGLSTFSSIMGCCTLGYLFTVQNCGVTIDPPCGSNSTTPTSMTNNPTIVNPTSSSTPAPISSSTPTPTSSSPPTPNSTGTEQTANGTSSAKGLYPFAALSIIAVAILIGINY